MDTICDFGWNEVNPNDKATAALDHCNSSHFWSSVQTLLMLASTGNLFWINCDLTVHSTGFWMWLLTKKCFSLYFHDIFRAVFVFDWISIRSNIFVAGLCKCLYSVSSRAQKQGVPQEMKHIGNYCGPTNSSYCLQVQSSVLYSMMIIRLKNPDYDARGSTQKIEVLYYICFNYKGIFFLNMGSQMDFSPFVLNDFVEFSTNFFLLVKNCDRFFKCENVWPLPVESVR